MAADSDDLRSQLAHVTGELAALRQRVERLEAGQDLPALEAVEVPPPTLPEVAGVVTNSVALVGRTLLELGGAYVLRALTDGKVISLTVGATLSLVYAGALLWLADRAGREEGKHGANFHGLAAMMIAFPAIGETTARMHVFSAPVAAALLVLAYLAGIGIAWRHALAPLGWVATLFAVVTSLALARGVGEVQPFVLALFCIAAATEVLAFDDDWRGPRWLGAAAVDLAMLFLASLAVREGGVPAGYQALSPAFVIGAQLALPSLYVVSIGVRTVVRGRAIRAFAVLQGPAALLIGLWGAARVLAFHDASPRWVGSIAVLLSVVTYAVAFAFAARHQDRASNYYFYTSLGGLLLLVGLGWLLSGPALGLTECVLAVAGVVTGIRLHRTTLAMHGAILLGVGAVTTGLAQLAFGGLFGRAAGPWAEFSPAPLLGLAAAVACFVLLALTRSRDAHAAVAIVPQLAAGVVAVVGFAGVLAVVLAQVVAGPPGPEADAALVAATRTGILSLAAMGLAALSRDWRLRELRWFVPVVLTVCGLKILFEDFVQGRPLSQFLTLAFYGAALLLTPRLVRRRQSPEPGAAGP